MTEPTGRVFISYRRKRLTETDQLIRALHDRGVPTWRDVDSIAGEPTEAAIRAALGDDNLSGAVLWLTPDVVQSPIIKDVEVPLAVARRRKEDGFWLVIVLADGLDYPAVTAMFADSLGGEDLSNWNLRKTSQEWATPADIVSIADLVLEQRIAAVRQVRSGAPHQVSAHAKGTMSWGATDELALDWTPYFRSGPPSEQSWAAMKAAAESVGRQLKKYDTAGDDIHYIGTPSMAAALLLGSTYSIRDGRTPTWIQRQPDGSALTPWRLADSSDASLARAAGWRATTVFGSVDATDLAVCLNISDDVSEAFARSRNITPPWRAIVRVSSATERNTRAEPLTPAEVASLVHLIVDEIRATRRQTLGLTAIHLFAAAPAGLAFLLGTAIATLPPITSYELDTTAGRYVPALTVTS